MPLSGTVKVNVNMTHDKVHDAGTGTTTTGGIDTTDFTAKPETTYAEGTGADQADLMYSDSFSIAAGANLDLDLAGGLTDEFGDTITFVKIKMILIQNTHASGELQIDQSVANGWVAHWSATSQEKIPAGGRIHAEASGTAGLGTVTAGTGDILRITNNDGSNAVTGNIIIIGTSA